MSDKIPSTPFFKPKRSLRSSLRNILFKNRRQPYDHTINTIGSGILRRDPSLCTLQYAEPTASFPALAEAFDQHVYEPFIPDRFDTLPYGDNFDVSSLASAVSMGHSLKPQLSLNSFGLFEDPVASYVPAYRRDVPQYHPQPVSISNVYGTGFSQHGSIATLTRTRSTLRIQRSDQSLRKKQTSTPVRPAGRSLRRTRSSVAEIRQKLPSSLASIDQTSSQSQSAASSVYSVDVPTLSRTPSLCSDASRTGYINHFSSFCILDTSRIQCPVSATSQDLKYIFEIGEEFCLNNRGCEGTSMDIVTGWDTAGNPITHLVLFSPLIIPSSGRSRFMLASLVDVTNFINDTASLPELETISEESSENEVLTPTYKPRFHSSIRSPTKGIHYSLSAEDLLGGCFLNEPKTPTHQQFDEDIWLNIATEEKKRSVGTRTPSNTSSISIDDVLDDFMSTLQELYSDFFMLAKSPFDDDYYEICNVSPRVYANKDYINGHLSKTSVDDMIELSARLAHNEPFTMLVRWGMGGVMKQMYCIPLFARTSTTWVCFLVDSTMPMLWC